MAVNEKLPLLVCAWLWSIATSLAADAELPPLGKWLVVRDVVAVDTQRLAALQSLVLPTYVIGNPVKVGVAIANSERRGENLGGFEPLTRLNSRFVKPNVVLKVDTGWICSFNEGEFGGQVWLYDEMRMAKVKLCDLGAKDLRTVGGAHFALFQDDTAAMLMQLLDSAQGPVLQEVYRSEVDFALGLSETVDKKVALLCAGAILIWGGPERITRLTNAALSFQQVLASANSMAWVSTNRAYVGCEGFVIRIDVNDGTLNYQILAPDLSYISRYESLERAARGKK